MFTIRRLITLLTALVSITGTSSLNAQNHRIPSTKLPQHTLQPFLENHCIKCHGPDKQKGQVRFDKGPWTITNNDSAQRWQDVLDQLNGGDMPPEEEDQPSQKELITVLDQLTGTLQTARQRLNSHGGEITMRRLNRREYNNTIRQLFGFELNPHNLPEDGEIQTFDTVGEEQFFTSAHFEKYLTLGTKIANQAINYNSRPYAKPKNKRQQPETKHNNKLRKAVTEADRKKAIKDAGGDWKAMGFKDEGDAKILFSQWESRVEKPRRYLQLPHIDQGVYVGNDTRLARAYTHTDPRADYLIRLSAGIYQPKDAPTVDPLRRLIRIGDGTKPIATRLLTGTTEKPQTIEIQARTPIGTTMLNANVSENISDQANRLILNNINKTNNYNRRNPNPNPGPLTHIWVDWIEIDGPYYPKKRPLLEDLLYPGLPTGGKNPYYNNDKTTRELIAQFTYHAFRRQTPDTRYTDALYDHFLTLRKQKIKYQPALAEVIGIVLSSPSFLYIQEKAPASNTPHPRLTKRELAVRLSYFLWSSPPDPELYAANLLDPRTYEKQIDRLLASPRSRAFTDGFIQQWAELDRYDAISIDPKEYFRYNDGLRHDAKQEVHEFFHTLVSENLPVDHLINSPFIVANATLATHYDLPYTPDKPTTPTTSTTLADSRQPNSEFKKIPLPHNSTRGGLLTQAAFLITGSNGERSSPVIRGALVMEKILHDKPSPPPPNVPELGSTTDKPHSNRQLVLMHQSQAVCASCHQKMDVIGFGLENFDPIGRWRSLEKVGKKYEPIIPGGTLAKKEFKNVQQLKNLLLDQKHKLAEELTESIFTYALGRRMEFTDQTAIETILKNTKKNNHRTQDIIKQIALSPLFKKP